MEENLERKRAHSFGLAAAGWRRSIFVVFIVSAAEHVIPQCAGKRGPNKEPARGAGGRGPGRPEPVCKMRRLPRIKSRGNGQRPWPDRSLDAISQGRRDLLVHHRGRRR